MAFDRVMLFSNADTPICDIPPELIFGATRTEVVNGEHKLAITTTQKLATGNRLLTQDHTGKWREWVINGIDEQHQNGARPMGTYTGVWSLQYDLTGVQCDKMPGVQSPVSARNALIAALSGTARWTVGTVNVTSTGGASMWQRSAWEALKVLIETWGGEIDATITVGRNGVTARKVDLLQHVGATNVTRRFEYGADLTAIRRKVADGPLYCRVVPLGAGIQDGTSQGDNRRRVTIASVNGGVEWLQNDNMVTLARVPDGSGGWEYPTRFVIYDGITDPTELKAKATADLEAQTVPAVTYTASVAQYGEAGVDVTGVNVGDDVHVVDGAFGADGLRLSARVTKLVTDELNPDLSTVTLGSLAATIANNIGAINKQVSAISNYASRTQTTMADFMSNLLEEINGRVNATGGWSYLIPGRGLVTYDVEIEDLTDDSAASQVTEIRGGTLRFANTRDQAGDWEYKTVLVSGHIATELVTAGHITAGYIGDPNGDFWDLDNHTLRITGGSTIAGVPASNLVTNIVPQFAESQSDTVAPSTGWSTNHPAKREGWYIWQRFAKTTASGTTYDDPVCISGRDGTSVTILGSYATYAQLVAAHPTGNLGDAYIVAGDLYVWNGSNWENVGAIQGPAGPQGPQGPQGQTGATGPAGAQGDQGVGAVEDVPQWYLSTSSTTQTGGSWSNDQPQWTEGRYIWQRLRTLWSDNTVTFTDPVLAKALNSANSTAAAANATAAQANATASAASTNASNALAAINGLDQVEIFNRLTNNGQEQGIFLDNGRLYLNADYMNAGVIGNVSSGNYWDLENGDLRIASTAQFGNTTVEGALSGISSAQSAAATAMDGNIIPYTANMDNAHGWTRSNATLSGGSSGVIESNSSGTLDWAHRIATPEFSLSEIWNKQVTFSFDAVATGGTASLRIEIDVYRQGSMNRFAWNGPADVSITTTNARKSYTGTFGSSTGWSFTDSTDNVFEPTDRARFIIYCRTLNRSVTISKWKLQFGSTATAWTPALADSSSTAALNTLTQTDVFNRLTNDGALQGLYMSGGNLYVNASYIQAGSLSAALITSGKLTSANGQSYFDLDNNLIRLGTSSANYTTIDSTGQIKSANSSGSYYGTVSAGADASGVLGQRHYLTYGGYVYGAIMGHSVLESNVNVPTIDLITLKYAKRVTIAAFYAMTDAQKKALFDTQANQSTRLMTSPSRFSYRSYDHAYVFEFVGGALSISTQSWIYTITDAGPYFQTR